MPQVQEAFATAGLDSEGENVATINDNEKYIFDTYTGKAIEIEKDFTYATVGKDLKRGNFKVKMI